VSGTVSFLNIDIICVYGADDTQVPIADPAHHSIQLQPVSRRH
jgi:hypothetical protein